MGPSHATVPCVGGNRLGRRKPATGMSLTKLPSGRWRARSVSRLLGGKGTFATKTEAKRALERARDRLGDLSAEAMTLRFWQRWTTDPLFARPKSSTNIHNYERTRAFVERYGAEAPPHS